MSTPLDDLLAGAGPLARVLKGHFEPRPQQGQMARGVADAMAGKSHLLVEAGTGVGKSFAYLLPAMLRCIEHNEVVVVATHTIALQEQLIRKDIPSLLRALDIDDWNPDQAPDAQLPTARPAVRPLLVKGRGNYVSIRRLRLASERQDRLFADAPARRSLHAVEDWALSTLDGTTTTLPPLERPGVWDKVNSDSGNCMGRRCPTFGRCFYQKARAHLEHANLLVCNHAVFFSDLALRAQEVGFLPKYHHVVLDEAHNVEEVAGEHFGVSLAEGRVQHLLTTLYHPRTGKGYLAQLSLAAGDTAQADRAVGLVDQCSRAARAFFDSLVDLVRSPSGGDAGASPFHRRASGASSEPRSVRLREPGAVANVLTPVFRELSLRLQALKDAVQVEADRYELNSYAQRAAMIADEAAAIISQTRPGYAYWVEVGGGGEDEAFRRATVACAPIEVGPILRERLFRQEHSVTLTSATLATRIVREDEAGESAETAFAHAMSRLGCEGARTMQLGSPFDYRAQAAVYIGAPRAPASDDAPAFDFDRDFVPRTTRRAELSDLSRDILHHVRETDGGAFVLFTSFSQLNRCAGELAGPLALLGMPLFAQGRDGSRTQILERFRENHRSVLLGAASFWQGVDVRGQNLRNVIITKLPFDPPDRPLTQARYELIESRGGNAFMEDSVPRAVIRFKQGFGRLIRAQTDRGRVVVLDDRILKARYGRLFLQALPPGVPVRVPGAEGWETL